MPPTLNGWKDAKSNPPAWVLRSRKIFWKASVGGTGVTASFTPDFCSMDLIWSSVRVWLVSGQKLIVLPANGFKAARMSSADLNCPAAVPLPEALGAVTAEAE